MLYFSATFRGHDQRSSHELAMCQKVAKQSTVFGLEMGPDSYETLGV